MFKFTPPEYKPIEVDTKCHHCKGRHKYSQRVKQYTYCDYNWETINYTCSFCDEDGREKDEDILAGRKVTAQLKEQKQRQQYEQKIAVGQQFVDFLNSQTQITNFDLHKIVNQIEWIEEDITNEKKEWIEEDITNEKKD